MRIRYVDVLRNQPYRSEMTSMTLRHPSSASDMAATYFTSRENTKSGNMCQTTCRLRFARRSGHLTNDLSMRDSPMAHGILRYFVLLRAHFNCHCMYVIRSNSADLPVLSVDWSNCSIPLVLSEWFPDMTGSHEGIVTTILSVG